MQQKHLYHFVGDNLLRALKFIYWFRLAQEELLQEAKRAKSRAEEMGPMGWQVQQNTHVAIATVQLSTTSEVTSDSVSPKLKMVWDGNKRYLLSFSFCFPKDGQFL